MIELINQIEKYAADLNLEIQTKTDNKISIWSSKFLGIRLNIEIDQNSFFTFYFLIRTSSWEYRGERTDLHDCISLFYAAYLKKIDICSSAFVEVANPATGSDVEIYARYIIPMQIHPDLINAKSIDHKKLDFLISSLFFFEQYFWSSFNGCPCESCRTKLNYKYEYRWKEIHPARLSKVANTFGMTEEKNYCERTLPTWFYYRDFKRRVTVIESKELIHLINALCLGKAEVISGVTGDLSISANFKNYLSNRIRKKILDYFKKLKDRKPDFLLLESKILAAGSKYILVLDADCGLNTFKTEKEMVQERHKKEFQLLFIPSNLIWEDIIDDTLFEELIKDLLEREPNVVRVRKLAATNEQDGGTDLIAEWNVLKQPEEILNEKDSPYRKINVVVQCKAYKGGVGKSNVQDIRDTVDFRGYDGYFLAVSSYTKRSLSDYLDKLRSSKKLWIDWWTRSEIEDRLKKQSDLLIKYSSLVKIPNAS